MSLHGEKCVYEQQIIASYGQPISYQTVPKMDYVYCSHHNLLGLYIYNLMIQTETL